MKTSKSDLKLSKRKVQLLMAEECMNPYDLCSKGCISYASYQRIMKMESTKIATG